MDSMRQAEIFRAFVKDQLRKQGLRFDFNLMRDIGREEKEFNERHKLNPPLSKVEFLELYVGLMKELAEEHFEAVERKIAEEKSRQ